MRRRGFLTLCAINLALLVVYVIADAYQWGLLRGLDLVVTGVYWDPVQIRIPLVGHPDGPLINAVIWMYNYSFMIVLATMVIDLVAVWRITRTAR